MPMMTAAYGKHMAQGDVMATSAVNIPFNMGPMSPGRPKNKLRNNTVNPPVAAERVVLTATREAVNMHP